jgi:hypothetical protein
MKIFSVSPFGWADSFNAITMTSVITASELGYPATRYNKPGLLLGSAAKLRPNRRLPQVIKKT